ncbi:copper homeostasis periplasmic binding protein CopC [Massilia putida]|uniref:copper homeostasis periplasmic binding protein CopC n=1 Tax=Massilia putida TaxID=1141883 RepID=UPI0009528985|nr:copper homeostasis periplasmic binding protein CopC [Massilia putida]
MSIKHVMAATVFAFASVAASSAFAHAKLQSSDPRAGSTLDAAPQQVRLKFNEALEPAFSKIQVTGPHNTPVAVGATAIDKADPTAMRVPLPQLGAGEYHIQWTAMTHDGHKMKGEVTFTVK